MVQSVELLLDPDTEAAVRSSWDALAAVDLPSLASNTAESNRPHVTLAVAETGTTCFAASWSETRNNAASRQQERISAPVQPSSFGSS